MIMMAETVGDNVKLPEMQKLLREKGQDAILVDLFYGVEELPGDDGHYKIHFTRRERMVNHPLVTGTLYVQSKGFRVLGFEGILKGAGFPDLLP